MRLYVNLHLNICNYYTSLKLEHHCVKTYLKQKEKFPSVVFRAGDLDFQGFVMNELRIQLIEPQKSITLKKKTACLNLDSCVCITYHNVSWLALHQNNQPIGFNCPLIGSESVVMTMIITTPSPAMGRLERFPIQ